MSFNKYKCLIEEGDSVVLYFTIDQFHLVEAKSSTLSKKNTVVPNIFQTPYGSFNCGTLIGRKYGSKIHLKKGWVYVLQPTPEFWTEILPHRTQIIYTPDVSMILFLLELKPSSVVIESGTGSASLSHAIIQRIKPTGHLYTFDFHETRVEIAKAEFENHGLSDYVTVTNRDVCANGFGAELSGKATSIFLDLPQPWTVASFTTELFKKSGGRLCSFSPCVEQVQKMCATLSSLGYKEIQTLEVLQSQLSVQRKKMTILNMKILSSLIKENEKGDKELLNFTTSVLPNSFPGHTGYLTLATFPPSYEK